MEIKEYTDHDGKNKITKIFKKELENAKYVDKHFRRAGRIEYT